VREATPREMPASYPGEMSTQSSSHSRNPDRRDAVTVREPAPSIPEPPSVVPQSGPRPKEGEAMHAGCSEGAAVLLVAAPDAIPWLLCDRLRQAGHALVICSDAAAAMRAALEDPPEVVVCNAELPDGDGAGLVRWVRAHERGPMTDTAVVVRCAAGDVEARLAAYAAGADACSSDDPAADAAVVAQVDALLRFARRERKAIAGSLEAIELASLISVIELEQRNGVLAVESEGASAHLEIADGMAMSGRLLGAPAPALEVVRAMLGWRTGRFAFHAAEPGSARTVRSSTGPACLRELLGEAARLADEATAA
jgi:DNA-binding response OmpR family regulator